MCTCVEELHVFFPLAGFSLHFIAAPGARFACRRVPRKEHPPLHLALVLLPFCRQGIRGRAVIMEWKEGGRQGSERVKVVGEVEAKVMTVYLGDKAGKYGRNLFWKAETCLKSDERYSRGSGIE